MSKAVAIFVLLGILLFAGCAGNSQNSQQSANTLPPKAQPVEQVPTPKQTYSCPDGSIVLNLSSCPRQKCTDDTAYGDCSSDKPKYCSNGALIDDAIKCGCPAGFDKDGSSCIRKPVLRVVFNTIQFREVIKTQSTQSYYNLSSTDDRCLLSESAVASGKKLYLLEYGYYNNDTKSHTIDPISIVLKDSNGLSFLPSSPNTALGMGGCDSFLISITSIFGTTNNAFALNPKDDSKHFKLVFVLPADSVPDKIVYDTDDSTGLIASISQTQIQPVQAPTPAPQPATPPVQTATSPSASAQDASSKCPATSNCQQISDSTKKDQCYNKAGQGAMGDVPCCLLIKNDQTLKDNCLNSAYGQMMWKVGSRDEYSQYCQYLSDTAKRDACYAKFYACSYLSTEALRQNCYILDKDCEKVSDPAKRDDCFVSRS